MNKFYLPIFLPFFLTLLFLAGTAAAEQQAPAEKLEASSDSTIIAPARILEVNAATLGIDEVVAHGMATRPGEPGWLNLEDAPAYHNRFNQAFWFHVPLSWDQPLAESRLLALEWPFFTLAEVYVCRPECHPVDVLPQWTSRLGPTIPLMFDIAVAGDQNIDVYLKLTADGKLTTSMTVWKEEAFRAHQAYQLIFLGGFFGILVVMALYNFVLSILLRDSCYLWYMAYVIATMCYTLTVNGVGRAFIWADASWSKSLFIGLSATVMGMMALQFYRRILKMDQWNSRISRATGWLFWLWFAVLIGQLAPNPYRMIATYVWDMAAFVTVPFLIVLGVMAWRRGNPTGMYLTIGWSLMCISTMIALFGLMGLIPLESWILPFQNFGIAIEMVLFSFALAERINRERLQREQAQDKAVQYLQLAAEAREKAFSVEREAKIQLESQVERRTRELRSALSRLENLNVQLDARSKMDGLTGLANRACFDEVFEGVFSECQISGKSMAVLMGDIDHFKQLNDTLGHAAGDACLMMVASIWQDVLSERSAVVARYGGEEFIA
ncbi:MAG: 7TM diverse intracellular signaling domain-containing protein, partial [Oceanobacter sp.]